MQAHPARSLREQLLRIALLHRRGRIFAGARALERIASGLDLSLDVAGLAGNTRDIFELIIERLELVIAHRPILDLIVRGHDALAVALDHVAADAEIVRQ